MRHRCLLAGLFGAALGSSALSAAGLTPVRVGVPEPDNMQFMSLWVALGAGYFQAEGIEPKVVTADSPRLSGQLLLDRQADIALLQPPVYLGMIAERDPVVLFANLLANDPINLVVRREVAASRHLDPAMPLVTRLNQMKGLRIGVGNEPYRRLKVLFSLAGMDATHDIQMITLPGDEQLDALKSGKIDALYTHTPFLQRALLDLGAVLIVNQSAGDVPSLTGGEIHTLGALRPYAAAHPDVIAAATRAIARAETLLHTDAAASAKAIAAAGASDVDARHFATIFKLYRPAVPASPHVSAAAIERDAALYPSFPGKPDFTKVHAADFILSQ